MRESQAMERQTGAAVPSVRALLPAQEISALLIHSARLPNLFREKSLVGGYSGIEIAIQDSEV
jgi:hypothetical protein